jgi:hypothetical protein
MGRFERLQGRHGHWHISTASKMQRIVEVDFSLSELNESLHLRVVSISFVMFKESSADSRWNAYDAQSL